MKPIQSIMGIIGILVLPFFLFFMCWLLAAGCSRAHVFVANQSGATISNLVVSGSCNERHTDTVATQSKWRTITPYDHDGMIRFSFDCAGASYSTNTELRSGFLGVFYTIHSNMIVTIEKKG
jgi:hypothetical protein